MDDDEEEIIFRKESIIFFDDYVMDRLMSNYIVNSGVVKMLFEKNDEEFDFEDELMMVSCCRVLVLVSKNVFLIFEKIFERVICVKKFFSIGVIVLFSDKLVVDVDIDFEFII